MRLTPQRVIQWGKSQVTELSEGDICSSSWTEDACMLVMPGGADLPYCEVLEGKGNSIIDEFVANGGIYLGLCAGAYYACQRVIFEPETDLEVTGTRELAFFPGTALGSVVPNFDYKSEAGASVVDVVYEAAPERCLPATIGVCHNDSTSRASARGVSCCPRPDDSIREERSPDIWTIGSKDIWDGTLETLNRIEFLITSGVEQQSVQVQRTARSKHVRDYVNGGPCFLMDECCAEVQEITPRRKQDVHVLARFMRSGRIAAVKCHHCKGVAILCSSHPELHPDQITDDCALDPSSRDSDGEQPPEYTGHVQSLKTALSTNQSRREAWFRELLKHAGLESSLRPQC